MAHNGPDEARSTPTYDAASPARSDAGPGATIRVCADGPLLVRGDFVLHTQDGIAIDARRATVALCRCGMSAIRPFCDGTHKVVGFQAASGREGR